MYSEARVNYGRLLLNCSSRDIIMYRISSLISLLSILLVLISFNLKAEEQVKPFVLTTSNGSNFDQILENTRSKLASAGFEILGEYSPYAKAGIIVFTNQELRNAATKSERGGYGGALRIAVTELEGEIQVAYTNPLYWSNAYRMSNNLESVSDTLASVFKVKNQFGTGEKLLSESDMRKYHYTFMMEYFDDPSLLARQDSHKAAVEQIEDYLGKGTNGTSKVYRLDLGKDTEGNQMTLFGVGLGGKDADDCSSDQYIMGRIDKSSPRHTAHLPYELLVYGSNVEALYGRFRIAISWPHLPMMTSDTGATFLSIMCAPRAIKDALSLVAGATPKKRSTENLQDRK